MTECPLFAPAYGAQSRRQCRRNCFPAPEWSIAAASSACCAPDGPGVTPCGLPDNAGGGTGAALADAGSDPGRHRPVLLLTRPLPQSRRFAAEFRQRFGADWPVVISPLMALVATAPVPDLMNFAGLILSSEHAVATLAVAGQKVTIPCYCVGQRTADAARALGAEVAAVAPDAGALERIVIGLAPPGPLLHLRGEHVAGDIANRLVSAGTETVSHAIYDQIEQPLTAQAQDHLAGKRPLLVPLFSPRSAQLFQGQTQDGGAPLWVAAFSQAVSGALTRQVARRSIAVRPDGAAMLDALAVLIDQRRAT